MKNKINKKDKNIKFGLAEIHGIEYWSYKEKEWKYVNIEDLKVLAVLGTVPCNDIKRWNTGHNFCIVFNQDIDQKNAYEDIISVPFKNKSNQEKYLPLTLYLIGKNNIKIPVLCAEGNLYDEHNITRPNTACLFAYLPPMIFDSDLIYDNCKYNHPKIKNK